MKLVKVAAITLASLYGLLGSLDARAADESLPAKLRVTVLFKTLTYDHKLELNRPSGLKIGIVMQTGNGVSQLDGEATMEAMRTFADKKVKGLTLSVESVSVGSPADLEQAITAKGCNALYLSAGLGDLADKAIGLGKARAMVVLAGDAAHVKKGAAIGAVQRAGKPQILVNLKAAAEQGAEMDSRLLRFVEVVD